MMANFRSNDGRRRSRDPYQESKRTATQTQTRPRIAPTSVRCSDLSALAALSTWTSGRSLTCPAWRERIRELTLGYSATHLVCSSQATFECKQSSCGQGSSQQPLCALWTLITWLITTIIVLHNVDRHRVNVVVVVSDRYFNIRLHLQTNQQTVLRAKREIELSIESMGSLVLYFTFQADEHIYLLPSISRIIVVKICGLIIKVFISSLNRLRGPKIHAKYATAYLRLSQFYDDCLWKGPVHRRRNRTMCSPNNFCVPWNFRAELIPSDPDPLNGEHRSAPRPISWFLLHRACVKLLDIRTTARDNEAEYPPGIF